MQPREFELKLRPATMRQLVSEAWRTGSLRFLAQALVYAFVGKDAVEVALQSSPDGTNWEEFASLRQHSPGISNLPASRTGGRWVRLMASANRGLPVIGRVRVCGEDPKPKHQEGKEDDHGR